MDIAVFAFQRIGFRSDLGTACVDAEAAKLMALEAESLPVKRLFRKCCLLKCSACANLDHHRLSVGSTGQQS